MKKRILIVDDDSQIRESLAKVLRCEGYDVLMAADGESAEVMFFNNTIDLVLLDLNLPDNQGWDVFGTLTSSNPFVPFVIITGRRNEREAAERAGVGALMEKPLDVPLLLKTIAGLISEGPEFHLKRMTGLHQQFHNVPSRSRPR